jgi:hypothetical protein
MRAADKSMRERDFLDRSTGDYDLIGAVVSAVLEGDHGLRANIFLQPTLVLGPSHGTTFTVNGAVGTTLEFLVATSGLVSAAVIKKPMGEVVAQWKTGEVTAGENE